MTGQHTEVAVQVIPPCDMCGKPASYDAKTKMGSWAWLCSDDFLEHGIGLGLGFGQRLVHTPTD